MKIRVEIYTAANREFSFRVLGGNSRITLTPGETYKTRGSVRRAVRTMAKFASPEGLEVFDHSRLLHACIDELDREQAAWNKRRRTAA